MPGEARGADGFGDDVADELAGGGVGGVGLDDDGVAGGEGRGGVSAGDGEGEGEVGRAEDGDGAEGTEHGAEVGLGRCAAGVGGVDAGVDPGALFEEGGEEPELAAGAGDLAGETRLWRESGLEIGALDERVGCGVYAFGDAEEECGAVVPGGAGEEGSGVDRCVDGAVELFEGRGGVGGFECGAIDGVDGAEDFTTGPAEFAGDDREAAERCRLLICDRLHWVLL